MRIPNPKSGWKQRHLTRCWILLRAISQKLGRQALGIQGWMTCLPLLVLGLGAPRIKSVNGPNGVDSLPLWQITGPSCPLGTQL